MKARVWLAVLALGCDSGPSAPEPFDGQIARISVEPERAWLVAGDSLRLSARSTAQVARQISWRSLLPNVAAVDSTGGVRGIRAGESLITASARTSADTSRVTVLPPPSTEGDPALGVTIYAGGSCGWTAVPAEETVIVDIIFSGAASPPTAEQVRWVNDRGGYVFYRYNVAAVRAAVSRDSIPVLVNGREASVARALVAPERYDVGIILAYSRPVTPEDRARLEQLGAQIKYEYAAALHGFAFEIADSSVPHLLTLPGAATMSQTFAGCAG